MANKRMMRYLYLRMYMMLRGMEKYAKKKEFEQFERLDKEFSRYYGLAVANFPKEINPLNDSMMQHFDQARNGFRGSFQDRMVDVEELTKKGRPELIELYKKFSIESLQEGKRHMAEISQMLKQSVK